MKCTHGTTVILLTLNNVAHFPFTLNKTVFFKTHLKAHNKVRDLSSWLTAFYNKEVGALSSFLTGKTVLEYLEMKICLYSWQCDKETDGGSNVSSRFGSMHFNKRWKGAQRRLTSYHVLNKHNTTQMRTKSIFCKWHVCFPQIKWISSFSNMRPMMYSKVYVKSITIITYKLQLKNSVTPNSAR